MIIKLSSLVDADHRFRHWGKRAKGNLDAENGNGLPGDWLEWEKNSVVGDGDYLVIAHEEGSAKYHSYKYKLLRACGEELVHVTKEHSDSFLEESFKTGLLTETQYANGTNNILAKYAIVIALGIVPCKATE